MDNNELFSGIPGLEDTAGLEAYLNGAALSEAGVGNQDTTPIALQQAQTEQQPQQTEQQPQQVQPIQQQDAPQFTAEQVADIVNRMQQAQQARNTQPQQPQSSQTTYSPRQAATIKQLIDRGVPLERILAAMNGNRQTAQQNAMAQRLAQVEQYLQQQQYNAAQSAFVDKMQSFGNKFGLNEDELVVFGNKAQSMGINLIDVTDVEAVFRAIYPEQYAIRSQRLAGASTAQIFGGANAAEMPRASASKLEDAYVDNFLKRSMPNQYGMYSK